MGKKIEFAVREIRIVVVENGYKVFVIFGSKYVSKADEREYVFNSLSDVYKFISSIEKDFYYAI
jgi:hypothetical protein